MKIKMFLLMLAATVSIGFCQNVSASELSNYKIISDSNGSHHYSADEEDIASLDKADTDSNLPKLTNPVNLQWHKAFNNPTINGASYFEIPKDGIYQGSFIIRFYKDGDSEPVMVDNWSDEGWALADGGKGISIDPFIRYLEKFESGSYYFTIELVGDGINYSNSDIVKSDLFTYVKSDKVLPAPINLRWDYPYIHANYASGLYGTYCLEYYYSDVETDDMSKCTSIGGSWCTTATSSESDGSVEISGSDLNSNYGYKWLQQHGDGYYYFRVKNLSFNILEYQNSEWSELSPAFRLTDLVERTDEKIDEITSNDRNEVRAALEAIGTNNLWTSMAADTNGDGTVKKIEALEEKFGGKAEVNVDSAVAANFDKSGISIIGANLNGDGGASLTIGAPNDNNHEIPPQYKNSLTFSMNLTGVDDSSDLKVPVQVILPVPSNMNKDFLKILHYLHTGGTEEISPYIFEKDGVEYAKFVLTSFSDFAFVERDENNNEDNGGDNNGDNGGNKDNGNSTSSNTINNDPKEFSFDEKGSFKIGYCHKIAFYGKSKLTEKSFGEMKVSYNGIEYTVSKVKVNKKNKKIQIKELSGADKSISKEIMKATKGNDGLSFVVDPYNVTETDTVTVKKKGDGTVKSVKVKINGKDYKAKKDEWEYDSASKLIKFKGSNLSGTHSA